MLQDKLEIVLVTYNRKNKLQRTLEQLFAPNSPVKNISITVLDNHSDDGTPELIQKYAAQHPNLRHEYRIRNVGANANIARAYEIATKPYLWVLCDDDTYDFSAWKEVEQAIQDQKPIIMVSKYALPDKKEFIEDTPYTLYHILQATFVPSVILNTQILDDTTLRNIYDNIYSMYVQLVPVVMYLNNGAKIHVISGPEIVHNGDDYNKNQAPTKHHAYYHRGTDKPNELSFRSRTMSPYIGVLTVLTLLHDSQIKILFANNNLSCATRFFRPFSMDFIYFGEIWAQLTFTQKRRVLRKCTSHLFKRIYWFCKYQTYGMLSKLIYPKGYLFTKKALKYKHKYHHE